MNRKTATLLPLVFILLALISSACDPMSIQSTTASASTHTSPSIPAQDQTTKNAVQILTQSLNTMTRLRSVHFTLNARINYTAFARTAPTNSILQALHPMGSGFKDHEICGEGDQNERVSHIALDEQALEGGSGFPFTVHQYKTDRTVYILGYDRRTWYSIDKSNLEQLQGANIYLHAGMDQLLAIMKLAQSTGPLQIETSEYQITKPVYLLRAYINDEQAIQQLIGLDYENGARIPLSTGQASATPVVALTFWIDPETTHVLKIRSEITYTQKNTTIARQILVMSFSNFNVPQQIKLPTHTQPMQTLDDLYPMNHHA